MLQGKFFIIWRDILSSSRGRHCENVMWHYIFSLVILEFKIVIYLKAIIDYFNPVEMEKAFAEIFSLLFSCLQFYF